MKLTGRCKEEFEKWLENSEYDGGYFSNVGTINIDGNLIDFFDLYESMQYGVLVDYFDSVGMQIYVKPIPTGSVETLGEWSVYIDYFGHHILTKYLKQPSRPQAREQAIIKACEIRNEQLNK